MQLVKTQVLSLEYSSQMKPYMSSCAVKSTAS